MTYKPEGDDASPSEETPSPSNESKPMGLDIVAVSSVEDSAPTTVPPPANNFDSEDLLVITLFLHYFRFQWHILILSSFLPSSYHQFPLLLFSFVLGI